MTERDQGTIAGLLVKYGLDEVQANAKRLWNEDAMNCQSEFTENSA